MTSISPTNLQNTDNLVPTQVSPCWARGKEIFFLSFLEAKKPPPKAEIQDFMQQNASLDGTINTCKGLQTSADASYNQQPTSRFVKKLLGTLTLIKQIGDPFMDFAPESVGIAWFAISALTQIGTTDIENCELIFGACDNIATILLTCRLYENRYQDSSDSVQLSSGTIGSREVEQKIIGSIPNIIASILDFCWYIRQMFKKNKVLRALKETFSPKLREKITAIEDSYTSLRQIASDAFQERIMDSVEVLQKDMIQSRDELRTLLFPVLDEFKTKFEDISSIRATLEISKLKESFRLKRASLMPSNVHMEQLKTTLDPVSRYTDHICQWLFQDPSFKEWELFDGGNETEQSKLSLFYIQARPGFGKSVALASTIQRLSQKPKTLVCYFFFKQGDEATQTTHSALSSIAAQLFDDKHTGNEEDLAKMSALLDKIGSGFSGSETSSTNGVVFTTELLKAVIQAFPDVIARNIYIIIDGIDECRDFESEALIRYLQNLAGLPKFKIMLSSRESQSLETSLRGESKNPRLKQVGLTAVGKSDSSNLKGNMFTFNLTEQLNSYDMETYLKDSIKKIQHNRSSRRDAASILSTEKEMTRIVSFIKQKAGGMFTYAAMVIASLEQPSHLTMKQRLNNLPGGMDELYKQRLDSLNPEEKKLILTALNLIVWGFGNIKDFEVAEHFKNIYGQSSSPSGIDSTSEYDDEHHAKPAEVANSASLNNTGDEATYDPLEDPEVFEAIHHLKRSGRDFLKFGQDHEIDIVHKTVRDWVKNEAEKRRVWQESSGLSKPKVFVNEAGDLSFTLSIPSGLVTPDSGGSISLRSERDAQLDISISTLTMLGDDVFAQRYMQGLAETGISGHKTSPANDTSRKNRHDFSIATYELQSRNFRYEALHLSQHLIRLQQLWPKQERHGQRWNKFWGVLEKFVRGETFRLWAAERLQVLAGYSEQSSLKSGRLFSPLHLFTSEGVFMVVEYLLEQKLSDPNIVDLDGRTPIFLSTRFPDITMLLIKHGAQINARYNGESIIMAIMREIFEDIHGTARYPPRPDLVDLLNAMIKDPNTDTDELLSCRAHHSITMLHLATMAKSIELFENVMEHSIVDIHATDDNKMTALSLITHTNMRHYPLAASKSMMKRLLDAGADPNHQDITSTGPLSNAVRIQDKGCVELLLQNGADVNDDDTEGSTSLHLAAAPVISNGPEDAEAILRLLLMYGADITKTNLNGQTALHLAAWKGYEKIFMILVQEQHKRFGPDESFLFDCGKSSKQGNTLLHQAARNRGAGVPIMKYITRNWTREQIVEMAHLPNTWGMLPLHYAVDNGCLDNLKWLLEMGADLNYHGNGGFVLDRALCTWSQSKFGLSTYGEEMLELQNRLEETVFYLIEAGSQLATKSDPEKPNSEISHGLRWAIKRYNEDIIVKLAESKYDLDLPPDEYGWTDYEHGYASGRLGEVLKLPGFSVWGDRKVRETKVPSKLIPTGDPCNLRVLEDGCSFETTETIHLGRTITANQAKSLRAESPIAAHLTSFYWEVTILDVAQPGSLYIGFWEDDADFQTPPGDTLVMADTYSLDGSGSLNSPRFAKDNITTSTYNSIKYTTRQGPITFGSGDTIGCGYSLMEGKIFYTLNGEYLGTAFDDVRGRLYPGIGCYTPCKGRVNFGLDIEPFMFKDMRYFHHDITRT